MMLATGMLEPGLLADTAALAAIALVGYLFGRRSRTQPRTATGIHDPLQDELARAQQIADEVRSITDNLAVELSAHQRSLAAFQGQLGGMQTGAAAAQWTRLRDSADRLVSATLKLTTNLTLAGGQLHRRRDRLSAFSASRIDPATGLHTRRSLEEHLDAFFSIHSVGKRRFSLALFSVGPTASDDDAAGDQHLRQIAQLVTASIREDDFVARYSADEFVVLMPQTMLAGALAFAERLLVQATANLGRPMWGGVVEATSHETAEKLLSRVDSALYSARAAGGVALFVHTGAGVRRHVVDLQPDAAHARLPEELAPVVG
jgi:diguanylate cyclase (GGDEF)-like protein